MKSNAVMTYAYDAPTQTLSWLFADGATVEFTIPGTVPDGNNGLAMIGGYKQTIADCAAMSRDATTGKSATVADKRAAMQKRIDLLVTGEWNAERTGGSNTGGLLALAIANLKQMDVANVRAFLKKFTKEQRDAMAVKEPYATEIRRIQAERVAEVDVDEMEDELDAME